MKNIVVLEAHEVGELWGEGLTLHLANGQQIIVKAEGERVVMGKIQVMMVSAEGNSDELQAMVRELARMRLNGEAPAQVPSLATAPPTAEIISNHTVAPAVEKVRMAAKKPRGKSRNTQGKFPCRAFACDRVLLSAQARGKHESVVHGMKKNAAAVADGKDAKPLPCGVNGCFQTFSSAAWRANHWRTKHGKEI